MTTKEELIYLKEAVKQQKIAIELQDKDSDRIWEMIGKINKHFADVNEMYKIINDRITVINERIDIIRKMI